jgi:hypothetical protein
MENDVDCATQLLYEGNRLLALAVREAVFLRPIGDRSVEELVACCAVDTRATRGVCAESVRCQEEERTTRRYVGHGW